MSKEKISSYFKELKESLDDLRQEGIEELADSILGAYDQGRQIFIMGNGGSASTASHFACDLNKGCCYGLEKKIKVMCLNDSIPTLMAYANDVAFSEVFVEQIKNFLQPNDLVIGISGSGNSENVIKAIQYANEQNANTFGLTGFDGGELVKIAKKTLVVPINDMQKIEDIHLVITHVIMQMVIKELNE